MSLFLDHLPYDIRAAIYAYTILPPFNGCRDYTGLWKSCRTLYDEINHAGTRQLRRYLRQINDTVQLPSQPPGDLPRIFCVDPPSVLGPLTLTVHVPFTLPPAEHDWYLQPPLRSTSASSDPNSEFTFYRPRPQLTLASRRQGRRPQTTQHNPPSHNAQQTQYYDQVRELLAPIDALHALHAEIEVHLLADEETLRKIQHLALAHAFEDAKQLPDTTPLGWLLDMHVTRLHRHSQALMTAWRGDWGFHARAVSVIWDFTLDRAQPRSRDCLRSRTASRNTLHVEWDDRMLVCTADCREGVARYRLDAALYVTRQLARAAGRKEAIAAGKLHGDALAFANQERYGIACYREKARILGMPGFEVDMSKEERLREIVDLGKKAGLRYSCAGRV